MEGAVTDFEPFIRYHTFNNSSIDFSAILRVREFTDQYLLKHEFVKQLHKRYYPEEILIPLPNPHYRMGRWKPGVEQERTGVGGAVLRQ